MKPRTLAPGHEAKNDPASHERVWLQASDNSLCWVRPLTWDAPAPYEQVTSTYLCLLCSLSPVCVACVSLHLPGSYRWRIVSVLLPSSGLSHSHLCSLKIISYETASNLLWIMLWWSTLPCLMRDSFCLWKSVFPNINKETKLSPDGVFSFL